MTTIRIVEITGDGGIHQHAVELAVLLAPHVGVELVTSSTCELEPPAPVRLRRDFDWHPSVAPKPWRAVRFAWSGARGWIGVLRRSTPGDVVHVEGQHLLGLALLAAPWCHRRRVRLVFSPHNTFSRRGSAWQGWAVHRLIRAADAVVVFSNVDGARVEAEAKELVVAPLVQWSPPVDPTAVAHWRERWGQRPTVAVPGQIRADKGLDTVVAAVQMVRDTHPDLGLALFGRVVSPEALAQVQERAAAAGVPLSTEEGYVPLGRFVAGVAAASVVICAYDQASQSGVLRLARHYGVPSIAADVGGLGEEADRAVPPGRPELLARAIAQSLAHRPAPRPVVGDGPIAVDAHLRAYGLAVRP